MYRGSILLAQIIILLAALGMMFNSAAVLGKPEGNYDAEARLSARIVFIICVVIAAWAAVSLFHVFDRFWLR
jgi:hypothetical protein